MITQICDNSNPIALTHEPALLLIPSYKTLGNRKKNKK